MTERQVGFGHDGRICVGTDDSSEGSVVYVDSVSERFSSYAEVSAAQARELAFHLMDAADAADIANGVFSFDFDPFDALLANEQALATTDSL